MFQVMSSVTEETYGVEVNICTSDKLSHETDVQELVLTVTLV